MYLYEKNDDKKIVIYKFVPNQTKLVKLKEKYMSDIKTVVLHVNNKATEERLFSDTKIYFSFLDRKEENGRITYMEEVKDNELVSEYIEGKLDSTVPMSIYNDRSESLYSSKQVNCDSTLLFTGGYQFHQEFQSDPCILLTGWLDVFQPLLYDDINESNLSYCLTPDDIETAEFFNMFKLIKHQTISLDKLRFLQSQSLIDIKGELNAAIEKSEEVLDCYRKVREKLRNKG